MIRRVSIESLALYQQYPCRLQMPAKYVDPTHEACIAIIQTIQTGDVESLSLADIQELANRYCFTRLVGVNDLFTISEEVIAIVANWYQKYHVSAESAENFPLEIEMNPFTGSAWYVQTQLPMVTVTSKPVITTFASTDINQVALYRHPWYRFTIAAFVKKFGIFPEIARIQFKPRSVELKKLNVGNQTKYLLESEHMLQLALTGLEKNIYHCNRSCTGDDTECSKSLIVREKLSSY